MASRNRPARHSRRFEKRLGVIRLATCKARLAGSPLVTGHQDEALVGLVREHLVNIMFTFDIIDLSPGVIAELARGVADILAIALRVNVGPARARRKRS